MNTPEAYDSVAIISMACCFPEPGNTDEFYKNLHDGTESATFFSDEELKASGKVLTFAFSQKNFWQ